MDIAALAARLAELRVVPVVSIDDADDAVGLADALAEGGLPIIEVTFRTDAAADAIGRIRTGCPDVLVGAGTVLDPATLDRALDAGAEFIVAPGFSPAVVAHAARRGVAMLPGAVTPTEIEMALAAGLRLLKFFPAEASGGVGYIKAVAAPYRGVRFVPTGGVTAGNLGEYLAVPAVAACGGTWIASSDAIRAHRWDDIASAAAEAMAIARSASRPLASRGSGWPIAASARASKVSSATSSSRRSTKTWQRERRAPLISKDGFSVVAPIRMMSPRST